MPVGARRGARKNQVGIQELPASTAVLDRLIAEGRATAASGDLLDLGLPTGKVTRSLTNALEAVREDRA